MIWILVFSLCGGTRWCQVGIVSQHSTLTACEVAKEKYRNEGDLTCLKTRVRK